MAEFISKVTLARPNSPSLRTTIPEGVAKMIELNTGDSLKWDIAIKDNKIDIRVSKKLKKE
jgi:antitoxin component of MazEF toxin-antitoxin module